METVKINEFFEKIDKTRSINDISLDDYPKQNDSFNIIHEPKIIKRIFEISKRENQVMKIKLINGSSICLALSLHWWYCFLLR